MIDDLIFYKAVYWREKVEDSFTKFKIDEDIPKMVNFKRFGWC